jgi:transposase-like protein
MDRSREEVLVYMSFPREHWAQIASTNPLERLNGEIKRRADVVGIFPNDRAVLPRTILPASASSGQPWSLASLCPGSSGTRAP